MQITAEPLELIGLSPPATSHAAEVALAPHITIASRGVSSPNCQIGPTGLCTTIMVRRWPIRAPPASLKRRHQVPLY